MRFLVFVAVATTCTTWLSAAQASPLFELTGDAATTSPLTARTLADGSGAAYFNPALLVDTKAGATFGFVLLNQRLGVALDGRPGTQYAVPEKLENARTSDGERFSLYPAATNLLQYGRLETATQPPLVARPRQGAGSGHSTQAYFVTGFVIKMFEDRVSFGFHGMLPNGEFTRMRAFYNDEREQYFSNSLHPELYADRMLALSLALGVGVKITDSISLGVGTTFALKTSVMAGAYVVDTGNLSNLLLNMDAPVEMGMAPHFGASFKLGDDIRLTATAHSPQQIELGAGFSFLLPNLIADQSELKFVLDYMPWRMGLGGSWDIINKPDHKLTLAAAGLYTTWSSYLDRHGDKPSQSYGFSDTLAPTVGITYQLDQFKASINGTYAPTPVPEQTGRTNYVDNDRLGSTLGAEYRFEALGTELKVGAQLQAHHMIERHNTKLYAEAGTSSDPNTEFVRDEVPDDAEVGGTPVANAAGLQTNNPGWPGFSSGGWILAGGIYVTFAL